MSVGAILAGLVTFPLILQGGGAGFIIFCVAVFVGGSFGFLAAWFLSIKIEGPTINELNFVILSWANIQIVES